MTDSRESYPKALLDLMARHFNLEEVRTLCFELGIGYEDLGGEGLRGKLRELILHADRRNLLDELLDALRRERPAVAWPVAGDLSPSAAEPRSGETGGARRDTFIVGNIINSPTAIGPRASVVVSGRDKHPPDKLA